MQPVYVLILMLDPFQELKCRFSYYQHEHKNSYLLQRLMANPPTKNEKLPFLSNPIR